jgi:hypothetical protein
MEPLCFDSFMSMKQTSEGPVYHHYGFSYTCDIPSTELEKGTFCKVGVLPIKKG